MLAAPLHAARKLVARPLHLLRLIGRKRWRLRGQPRDRFTRIYEKNYWKGAGSRSGGGSSLAYTENLRARLPELLEKLEVQRVFDAPCGDFHWMQEVVAAGDFAYIGGDTVPALIERLKQREGPGIEFCVFDITQDEFPDADLWISRDCWFHLSNADIWRSLDRFMRSNIKYLLATSHVNENAFENKDIRTGSFRRIDLFSPPFDFSRAVLHEIDDWIPPYPERKMYLWERSQLAAAVERQRNRTRR